MKRDEGLDDEGESAGDDLAQQAKEDERRMKFSFAVAEMIAMESQTKQLLLQVMVMIIVMVVVMVMMAMGIALPWGRGRTCHVTHAVMLMLKVE